MQLASQGYPLSIAQCLPILPLWHSLKYDPISSHAKSRRTRCPKRAICIRSQKTKEKLFGMAVPYQRIGTDWEDGVMPVASQSSAGLMRKAWRRADEGSAKGQKR